MVNIVKFNLLRLKVVSNLPLILFICLFFQITLFFGQITDFFLTTQLDYISRYKDIAIREMKENKIPASITLSQGLLESGAGKSNLAVKANNHFGIKCHKDWIGDTYYKDDDTINECFRKYATAEESFVDHSIYLHSKQRYAGLFDLDITDYKAWSRGLKAAGYATNPKYADILINTIDNFKLYLIDQEALGLISAKNVTNDDMKNVRKKEKQSSGEYFISIGRTIFTNNKVRYIETKQDDSFYKIAKDLGLMLWQLYKYNDLDKNANIVAGEKIYIEPKKRKSHSTAFHTVLPGETLQSISQLYGVKLKMLYKRNQLKPNEPVQSGQKIYLQKP